MANKILYEPLRKSLDTMTLSEHCISFPKITFNLSAEQVPVYLALGTTFAFTTILTMNHYGYFCEVKKVKYFVELVRKNSKNSPKDGASDSEDNKSGSDNESQREGEKSSHSETNSRSENKS